MRHVRLLQSAHVALLFLAVQPAVAENAEVERLNGLVLDKFLEAQARTIRVTDRIRIAAAQFCGDEVVAVAGVYVANRYTFLDLIPRDLPFEKALNASAVARFGLDKRPRVLIVEPELPAARAGVRAGDIVTGVGGKKLSRRTQIDSLRIGRDGRNVLLSVERDSETVELEMETRLGCAPPSRFMFGTEVNAFATHFGASTGVYVFGGMLDFFDSDDQLAVIMGHEMAHMILKHTQALRASRESEADADYLGLYLAARADFDVSRATDVWVALGRANPFSTIDWGHYSHPMSPARSLMLRATVAEIAAKRDRGEALEPAR